jgi:hypothetical protein
MAADKTGASSKACVPVRAAMIGRGDMAAACEMTRAAGKVCATAHMSARSVAATHSVASAASCVAPATTGMLRQCRSRARQNQS